MAQFTVVQEQESATEGGILNPKSLMQMLRRRALPVIITLVAVCLLTGLGYWIAPHKYEAVGSVALDRRTDELVEVKSDQKPLVTDSSSVETEVQVIRSPAVAAAVVDGLGLEKAAGYGWADSPAPNAQPSRDRAIRAVQQGLSASRAGTSYAILVKFTASDPLVAARVVNAAMNAYTGGQRSTEARQVAEQINMLRDRIKLVRGELMRTESSVAQYRGQTGLIDLAANSDAANQSMQQLNTQLAQARADEAAARAKSGSGASIANAMSSGATGSLRSEQAKLSAQEAELSQRYANDHPSLIAVREQLGAVNRALAAEQARVRQGVAAEASVASGRASSLRGSVNRQQSELMRANAASVHLAELERNADAAKTLYGSLLDQYKQKLAAQGTEQSKAYVVAYAAPPVAPASPNPWAYLIGGLVAAILAAAAVATWLENMEGGVFNQADAERELGLPVLAAIPDVSTVKDAPLKRPTPGMIADQLLSHPSSLFAESIRRIRTSLNLGQEGQVGKIFAVTSAVADEGKTTLAICLARSAALAGSRVLIIDCDLRHHACTDFLAPNPRSGLVEVLSGGVPLRDALVRDPSAPVDVLPSSSSSQPSVDAITPRAMRSLLRGLTSSYDLIILETSPVLPVAESRTLSAVADGTILAVRWRKTSVEVANKAITLLNRSKAKIVGTVLSRVSLSWSAMGSLGDDVYYYHSYEARAA